MRMRGKLMETTRRFLKSSHLPIPDVNDRYARNFGREGGSENMDRIMKAFWSYFDDH